MQQAANLRHPLLDNIEHRLARIELWLLRQVADAQTLGRTRLTSVLVIDTGHDLQQRALAGAVGSEHADLGTGEKRQGNVIEQHPIRGHGFAKLV